MRTFLHLTPSSFRSSFRRHRGLFFQKGSIASNTLSGRSCSFFSPASVIIPAPTTRPRLICCSDMSIRFRPIAPGDEPFLSQVYASTRIEELAVTDWNDEQKAAFLQMQFAAQHTFYQENYTSTDFLIVLQDDIPVGRLYVARWKDEIRIVDIALLPRS